jgi:hypothetical protein
MRGKRGGVNIQCARMKPRRTCTFESRAGPRRQEVPLPGSVRFSDENTLDIVQYTY